MKNVITAKDCQEVTYLVKPFSITTSQSYVWNLSWVCWVCGEYPIGVWQCSLLGVNTWTNPFGSCIPCPDRSFSKEAWLEAYWEKEPTSFKRLAPFSAFADHLEQSASEKMQAIMVIHSL